MMAHNSTGLPALPVPQLEDTLKKLLDTVRPLVSTDEYKAIEKKVQFFASKDGMGPVLQARLKTRAEELAGKSSWLEEWWNDYAYFSNRESICFNVNYFFGFRPLPSHINHTQADVASILIHTALAVRENVESGNQTPATMRGKPLCMHQYKYMFGTCRHPGDGKDWTEKYSGQKSRHVMVVHKGQFYSLDPYNESGDLLSIAEIKTCISQILSRSYYSSKISKHYPPIGILTTTPRQQWFNARETLTRISKHNADAVEKIESSAFLLSLEDTCPQTMEEMSRACWHGDGKNRYYDKNFQLLTFANGRYGFNGEHSLTDATTDMDLCRKLVTAVESTSPLDPKDSIPESTPSIKPISFDYNDSLGQELDRAMEYFNSMVRGHEYCASRFELFGKELIKSLKVSPDAFTQMAFQLAYHRLFGHTVATYESASTRGFARGRTETSRSVSDISKKWCIEMAKAAKHSSTYLTSADSWKIQQGFLGHLLRDAANHQSVYTASCAKGQGIDRHLLGLQLALEDGEQVPELFNDDAFVRSKHWTLSTSQISDPILDVYGWGEVVSDGFGIAYSINENSLYFGISSQNIGSHDLSSAIQKALIDMRDMLQHEWDEPMRYTQPMILRPTKCLDPAAIAIAATCSLPRDSACRLAAAASSDYIEPLVKTPLRLSLSNPGSWNRSQSSSTPIATPSLFTSMEKQIIQLFKNSFNWISTATTATQKQSSSQ
ncbi:Carnitine O-acetyltransferase mitochondrial [Mycoemilia scoparia]|uniref:Carnitine O-acetyltransferase mitochondrial n=1 Tax=Mycoemilia scoparia TaxID=417184 RepID=A0A9W8DMY1_9FUNG|nr:Carnitine O-acetyltransferase mitochondrial [Mycoemilia scoparia]